MVKRCAFFLALRLALSCNAQTAMPLSGVDCNGITYRNLYSDLDAGKAVVLIFFMPNCASCPPVAKKIQAMANNINATHSHSMAGYALPFNNSTTCATAADWVSTNNIPLFVAMDSGATQVAYYGGFGMPTVVLLGGADHRVMFVTQSFTTSDTAIMRDSILALLDGPTNLEAIAPVKSAKIFPNPATDRAEIELELLSTSNLKIEIVNSLGQIVRYVFEGRVEPGILRKAIELADISNGLYSVRVLNGNRAQNYKLNVQR